MIPFCPAGVAGVSSFLVYSHLAACPCQTPARMRFATRHSLQQLSDSWSRQGIASMGEPRDRIIAGDRLDRYPHGLPERLLATSAEPAQNSFDLGECLLDRREIGRVGR